MANDEQIWQFPVVHPYPEGNYQSEFVLSGLKTNKTEESFGENRQMLTKASLMNILQKDIFPGVS